MDGQSIRVAIIEDSADLNEALRLTIGGSEGLECTTTYLTGEQACAGIVMDPPDIVLVDLGLPGMSGQECITILKDKVPKLQFLVFTIKDQDEQVFSALKAGATGYLLKSANSEEIVGAIKELNDGGAPMSTSIARKVVQYLQDDAETPNPYEQMLTNREKEVLQLLSRGKFYKEIAAELYISTETVKSHCHNIYEKLHVSTRTEALNKYYQRG
ncbi:MAG: response regulator transcription factor [Saprospiraceae bacterium]|nr:response regulator transcription factor [Saprospiraceae bacterium]